MRRAGRSVFCAALLYQLTRPPPGQRHIRDNNSTAAMYANAARTKTLM
jgi:hypothetical protein